jgi:hypothetical protein
MIRLAIRLLFDAAFISLTVIVGMGFIVGVWG